MRKGVFIVTLLSAVAALGMWVVDGINAEGGAAPAQPPAETSVRFNDPNNSTVWYVLTNNVLYRYEDLSSWIDSRVTLYDVTYCDNPFPLSTEQMQTWSVENATGQFTPGQPDYSFPWDYGEYVVSFEYTGDLVVSYIEGGTTYSWARYRYVETPYGMGYEGYASSMGDPPFTSGHIVQFTGMDYQTNITENVKVTQ